ncbi:hypothetical protein [Acinetobacter baumannii]|uniref:Uncharacterized protein n=1 Tax=Acinetobacter baumannii TaxID=470 RepID=A0A6I4HR56_ACIBA|nr:hypothetical protein [Acinetobacter baumannii]AYY89227.1 hypothetical protein EGM95_10840 [Acinetobacter baumannii]AYY89239.1 hypothetical protein EGM95_10900 [Acinetobacter baumannii]EKV1869769.1 hypothetical protein [Acinetobacter baumannii]EKV1947019.1 hypothetical protein [Acinetobacter baumannii]EKW4125648.1 hypothetical protein [Acinetobacter baumannii]
MQFKTTITVLGAKSSKGEFNGKPYDSTTIFFQAELQDGDNFVGQVGEQIRWGTSANFEKLKDLKFPLNAEATMEQVSNGKSMVTILKDLVPQVQK